MRVGEATGARSRSHLAKMFQEDAMSQFNRVVVIGAVARPVALRWVKDNLAVADLCVRVRNTYTDREGKRVTRETPLEIVAFGETAERCAAGAREGEDVLVQGRLKMEQRGQGEGAKQTSYVIVCEHFEPLAADAVEAAEGLRRTAPIAEPEAVPRAPVPAEPPPRAPDSPAPVEPEPARAPVRRRVRPQKPSGAEIDVGAAVA
jgi:single-stranded DNA-binding protein